MTKKLSTHQEMILTLCLSEKFMSCNELLLAGWALQTQEQGSKKDNIAKAEYCSAHAALSRCLTRLWGRGLIVYWKTINRSKTGITLTPEGETLIRAILEEADDA
jgi:hypothetical protein